MTKISQQARWNERFSRKGFAYGEEANEFLKSTVNLLPKGRILCIGEGEGRNALFLTMAGYEVTAIDISDVGLEKTRKRANEKNVTIKTIHADLTQYDFGKEIWQGIVSIYFHVHKDDRAPLHHRCVEALTKDGVFIMESYSTNQLKFETGGPKNIDLLLDLNEVRDELNGLDFKIAREIEREIIEGDFHTGMGSVVQIVGIKK
jgi:SAM-dependent methyltransferase